MCGVQRYSYALPHLFRSAHISDVFECSSDRDKPIIANLLAVALAPLAIDFSVLNRRAVLSVVVQLSKRKNKLNLLLPSEEV